jgi:predicted O-methyltransferase YrrM
MVSFGFRHVADVERYKAGTLATVMTNLATVDLTDRVTIVQGYSQTALAGGMPFIPNFAFIDGDHARDACYTDLRNCERLMEGGGVICVHDYDEDTCPGVREAVNMWGGQRDVIDSMAVIRL